MSPIGFRFFYGWVIVCVTWVCYGFGISPAFYSWGNFAAPMISDLGLTREDIGGVFGLFNLINQCVGVLVGFALVRFGIRSVMVIGFLTTAFGMLYLTQATSPFDCYMGFAVLGGMGVGFSTVAPCQTLAQNWFLRRRALVLAVIFTAGGLVAVPVVSAGSFVLEHYDWRVGWLMIAVISMTLAAISVALVRDTPEVIGQLRDGVSSEKRCDLKLATESTQTDWTASQAVRTSQFVLVVVCSVAYVAPWSSVVAHLNLHLQDIGYPSTLAASFVGMMALISIAGRLFGTVGDWVPPQYVLASALVLEGLGVGGLVLARSEAITYVCIVLLAFGFGTAYVSIPVVVSRFFGRRAFSVTTGVRLTITGLVSGPGPWLTGRLFDATGTYTISFLGLMVVGLVGAASAALLRHPGVPPPRGLALSPRDAN